MRSFKLNYVISLLCLALPFSATAEEPNIVESLSNRMFELAVLEFKDLSPTAGGSFYDARWYVVKEDRLYLISGTLNKEKQEAEIEV
ncbi:hypothetical protein K8R32_05365, partial [bacterium]|nr:hypothetical protein [bacterium]